MTTDMMTLAEIITAALVEGDKPEDLVIFIQHCNGQDYNWGEQSTTPAEPIAWADLPTEPIDVGYGGTDGPPCIAFSDRYVYVYWQYDGAQGMNAVPRHPEYVQAPIPWLGG